MKAIFFTIALCCTLILCAQPPIDNLRDDKWIFGDGTEDVHPDVGNMLIDFMGDTLQISTLYTDMEYYETNASICDTLGHLLFYTNGIHIRDRNHQVMAGWDTLNPGLFADIWFDGGYRLPQGALILPRPGSDSLYYIFHSSYGIYEQLPRPLQGDHLYYTLIDMSGNNGLGEIIDLNHELVDDFLAYGNINACRHANGRDWWILMPQSDSSDYYIFLLDPSGVHDMGTVGGGPHAFTIGLGQGVFSPDGSKYALYSLFELFVGNYLYVYNFDRCSGVLEEIAYDNIIDTAYCGGAAISPNSRYLYLPSHRYLYQYDLEAADIAGSKTTVAVWDGFMDLGLLATTFYLAQLAPNGKIYISSNTGVRYLHVIEQPDSAGLACNVAQHGLQLPHFNAYTMPHFPNFRLGALENSPCDTLPDIGTAVVPIVSPAGSLPGVRLSAYPNPAVEVCHLSFGAALRGGGFLRVYDVWGRLVHSLPLSIASVGCSVDVRSWPAGVYIGVLYDSAGVDAGHSVKFLVGE